MPEDDPYTQFMTVRAKPPPILHATLHWDGMHTMSGVQAAVLTKDITLLPSPLALTIDWVKEATRLLFYLEPELLLPTVRAVLPGATGTLIWVHEKRDETCIAPTVHPVLLVHTTDESFQVQYAELVPHLPRHDPLLHHMALVLQAAVEAEGVTGCLYAEALANALAVHLLSRYAIGRHLEQPFHGGLVPSKLHRTIAYILAHLEHKLSLDELAAVAQISPAHFARLFKYATGQTPHQYVITCRMDQAKRLLVTTDLSLSQIGLQVGCTDQSHFTALFRKYVSTTPKAYRNTARPTLL